MHRTLCPQTASLSIADVITSTPKPRHTKLMCLLDPSAFTMPLGSRHKAKRPEGLLARLSIGSAGIASPNKGGSPGKASQIKVSSILPFIASPVCPPIHACIHALVFSLSPSFSHSLCVHPSIVCSLILDFLHFTIFLMFFILLLLSMFEQCVWYTTILQHAKESKSDECLAHTQCCFFLAICLMVFSSENMTRANLWSCKAALPREL